MTRAARTARQELDRGMSEDEVLTVILEAATFLGWRCHHDRRSDKALQQGHAGFPDLVLARDGRIKVLELKSAKGQLTEDQWAWRRAFVRSGPATTYLYEYRVVTPADLDDVIASLR